MRTASAEQVLEDLLRDGLDVVFCGTQAGLASALRRAYYAGPGNCFWATLRETGLVPEYLQPRDYRRLLEFRVGLTDVAKKTAGADSRLKREHFDVEAFCTKIERHTPRAVAFNGKRAAGAALNTSTTKLHYGAQQTMIGRSRVFVLPSTSGAARRYWDIGPWHELAAALRAATG